MILDERTEFCDATSLSTAGTGPQLLGDQIDLTVARDIGSGQPVYAYIQVDTAVTSTGSATVQFEIASDASAAIATDGTATEHVTSPAYPVATLTAGFTAIFPLPLEGDAYERYVGLLANVGTAALNGGKINAGLTTEPRRIRAYPDAVDTPAST